MELVRLNGMRNLAKVLAGKEPGPEGAMSKLFGQHVEQDLHELALDLGGEFAILDRGADDAPNRGKWALGWLRTRASTIGGGHVGNPTQRAGRAHTRAAPRPLGRRVKFEFTEEHEALRSLIAEVCAREAEPRGCYDGQAVIDSRLWGALCSAGVIGVAVSEAYEGGGAGPVEQVIIAEELGRAVAAVPFDEHSRCHGNRSRLGSDRSAQAAADPLARGESVAGMVLPTRPTSTRSTRAGTGHNGDSTAACP